MHRFHIGYRARPEDRHTKGTNIDADSIETALTTFKRTNKGSQIHYIEDKGKVTDQRF